MEPIQGRRRTWRVQWTQPWPRFSACILISQQLTAHHSYQSLPKPTSDLCPAYQGALQWHLPSLKQGSLPAIPSGLLWWRKMFLWYHEGHLIKTTSFHFRALEKSLKKQSQKQQEQEWTWTCVVFLIHGESTVQRVTMALCGARRKFFVWNMPHMLKTFGQASKSQWLSCPSCVP